MKARNSSLLLVLLMQLALTLKAQTGSPPGSDTAPNQPEEKKAGGFIVNQSIEFGYRFVDISSQKLSPADPTNPAMYNTFVNLHTGPRLLEQTLSLRSPEHAGLLFDDLSLSASGFGGDPNDLARVQISKYKWYDFNGLFRRDWNFSDYNLLANPLNPNTSNPAIPVLFSPHRYDMVRRMTDLNLTLRPESSIRFRLGYGRNTSEGLSFTTIPEASDDEVIETLLNQHNRVNTDDYHVGVDVKLLPRTVISYDQFVAHTKTGTTWRDQTFAWSLPDGTPADLGIVWNTTAGQPCDTPFSPAPPVANPACSLYLSYTRSSPIRTTTPTEQLSFHSNYFSRLDLTGRATYSSTDMTGEFNDLFNGFMADTGTRQYATSGPLNGTRIAVSIDFGATFYITQKLRLSDQFRFYNFRIPSLWNSTLLTWAGTSALDPVGPTPDALDNLLFTRFLGENTKSNEIAVEYDFSKRVGGRVGYRYQNSLYRHLGSNNDLSTGDIETDADVVPVKFHSALVGLWARPTDKLRANVDLELRTSDNFLTRISPRRLLQYRVRTRYQPNRRLSVAATADVYEARNGIQEISYKAHNRNFGFTTTAARSDRLEVELAYNYNNAASGAFVCFQDTAPVVPGNAFTCAADTEGGAPFEVYQTYSNRNHYGSANFMVKPMKRLVTKLGYSIVSTSGDATILNPLQPFGTLKSNYHRPLAEVQFEVSRGWSAIARWNYYEYLEKDPFFGPTAPRDFHANATTLSLRYAF